MRVGLVIYGSLDLVSGGYLYDRKLVSYLRSRGDRVEVISLPAGSYFSHLLGNFHMRLPRGLDILIEDELVHPSLLMPNRNRREYPIVSLVHNLHSSEHRPAWQNALYRRIENQYLLSVDGYIFNSVATRDSVIGLAGHRKPSVLAPPGGDRLGTIAVEIVRRRAARSGPLRIVFLASVTPLKGLDVLLTALERLPANTVTLDVAGSLAVDAPYAMEMQRRAASLQAQVIFHDVLDAQPLGQLLSHADVLVVPSYWEGFGIAYLEGMAFGLPAIGTTAGAIPQTIAHGVNGYLISPGDSRALSSLLQQLASDRQLLQAMSERALMYFATCPTWAESGEIIRDFLFQILDAV